MTAAMSAADLAIAVAVGAALLLIAAGVGHLRHRAALRAALRAQGLLPRRLRGPVGALTPAVELGTGLAVLTAVSIAVVGPAPLGATAGTALIAQAILYGVFAGYLWVLRSRRPAAPCGCFAAGGRVTPLGIARAVLLAAGSGGAVLSNPATGPTAALVWLAGGFVVAMLAWLLPVLTDG